MVFSSPLILHSRLSHYPPLLLSLAEVYWCSTDFNASSPGLSNPQAEPTPVADRILLEYKGYDLQPQGAVEPATAAEWQEREVVHHAVCISPAIAVVLLVYARALNFTEMKGGKVVPASFVTNYN